MPTMRWTLELIDEHLLKRAERKEQAKARREFEVCAELKAEETALQKARDLQLEIKRLNSNKQ